MKGDKGEKLPSIMQLASLTMEQSSVALFSDLTISLVCTHFKRAQNVMCAKIFADMVLEDVTE